MEKWTTLGEPDRATATGISWPNVLRLELGDDLPEGNNFYEDGKIIGGSNQLEPVLSNQADWISFSFAVDPSDQPDYIGAIEVFDDDGSKISYDLLPISGVINDHVKTNYATSFIDIVEVDSDLNPRPTIPFDLYSTVNNVGSALNNNQDMRGADSKFYWYWFTAVGYQAFNVVLGLPVYNYDGEPEGEPQSGGATISTLFPNRFTKVFVAGAEDYDYVGDASDKDSAFRETFDDIVAHEIGHGPDSSNNGDHDAELGLMSAGESAVGEEFSKETILRFRNADKWDE